MEKKHKRLGIFAAAAAAAGLAGVALQVVNSKIQEKIGQDVQTLVDAATQPKIAHMPAKQQINQKPGTEAKIDLDKIGLSIEEIKNLTEKLQSLKYEVRNDGTLFLPTQLNNNDKRIPRFPFEAEHL